MRPRKAGTTRATVLAVTSGKGGVGKTNVTINVAIAMARLGLRVGVLDADFGLGNIDVLLGIAPGAHVGHLVAGEKKLQDVVVRGPHGITIIPASSGLQSMTSLTGTSASLRLDKNAGRSPACSATGCWRRSTSGAATSTSC